MLKPTISKTPTPADGNLARALQAMDTKFQMAKSSLEAIEKACADMHKMLAATRELSAMTHSQLIKAIDIQNKAVKNWQSILSNIDKNQQEMLKHIK